MSEPIFKDIDEFTEKEILGDNDFVPVSATEKINLKKQFQKNVVATDITTAYPLEEGKFYTLETAIAKIDESVKKLGAEISFVRSVNDKLYNEVYKYMGTTIADFSDESLWKLQQSYEYGNFLDFFPELYLGSDNTLELEPIGNGTKNISIPNQYPVETRYDFEKFEQYLYIPRGFIFKTIVKLVSSNGHKYVSRMNLLINGSNVSNLSDFDGEGATPINSGYIHSKGYIYMGNKDIYIKPGDTLTILFVVRKDQTTSDTVSVVQTTDIPAMVMFFDKKHYHDLVKKNTPAQMTATGFILNNPTIEPDSVYYEKTDYSNLFGNGGGYLKWSQSTLQLYMTALDAYIDGVVTPNEFQHKLYLENTGTGTMTVSLINDMISLIPETRIKSTFGSSFTLAAGKSIFIRYQWYWDSGTFTCLIDKSSEYVTI